MRDINDVLRQKESEIQQLQKEIEALRIAARLLADDNEATAEPMLSKPAQAGPTPVRAAVATPAAAGGAKGAYSAAWENAPKQFP